MWKNYLTTAWRNLLRNKVHSFIHVSGLGIGMACALLIWLFITSERQYDTFYKDADRIFQVVLNGNMNGQEFWAGNTPPPVGNALYRNIPEIETYTRFYKPNNVVVRYQPGNKDGKFFTEKNVLAVDSNFFQVFDFKTIEGNVQTALMKPGSVVITEKIAFKYFGHESAVGKTLLMHEKKKPFIVTAVIHDVPAQSSIQFDFLTPVADYPAVKQFSWSWVWLQTVCYVKLKNFVKPNAASVRSIEAKFPSVVRVQAASGFDRIGKPFDEFVQKGGKWDFHLLPLKDIHLRSASISMPWLYHISNIQYIYIFGSIAIFIILLACVNFMNLSTAKAVNRAKEVGVRKVNGSTKVQLVQQFLTEAFVYSIIAALCAVAIVALSLKAFTSITDEPMSFAQAFTPSTWVSLLCMTIGVAIIAGSYPAFYLTSFKPVSVLKGNNMGTSGRKNSFIRNALVVFQFSISTMMIIGTLVVLKQLHFFRNTDLGFSKENVLVITGSHRLGKSEESFRQTIMQIPGVEQAAVTTSIPSGSVFGDSYQPEPESAQTTKEVNLNSFMVDESFVPALNIKVLQGRNFSRAFSDSASVILNEEAVKEIGWKNPIGKWIDYPGGDMTRFKVIGVVKDFNVQSLQQPMIPFALFHTSSNTYDLGASYIVARIHSKDLPHTLQQVEGKWKNFVTGEPFDFSFLDADFDAQYRSEQRLGSIFTIFAGLSVLIACLGLFGLCAYVAERRAKEIGIRKVLGASVQNVVFLMSRNFIRLTLIAALIAFPIAGWMMNRWLEDFSYRINIDWSVFILAGLASLLISILTITFQSVRAAMANPTKSLRSE